MNKKLHTYRMRDGVIQLSEIQLDMTKTFALEYLGTTDLQITPEPKKQFLHLNGKRYIECPEGSIVISEVEMEKAFLCKDYATFIQFMGTLA